MDRMDYAVPAYTTAAQIREIRQKLELTQKEFARLLCVSRPTVERMERSEEPVTGPIVLLLTLIEKQPENVRKLIVPKQEMPLRIFYMYREKPCTRIDADELRQKVEIENYTDNVFFRAFGTKEEPTYADLKAFLKSRCFPEERDMMKLELKRLGIPFYDPMLIIEKTEGRMAEDDFWLKVERKQE